MGYANSNYDLLLSKLDKFIRKFYVNQLLRGSLYTIGLVLASFLLINLLEYFFYFPSSIRKGLLYGFLGLSGISLILGVLMPLMHFFRLGKIISHEQAAQIIGNHFGNVKDKLLNVLQLKHQANSLADTSLIEASIDQKIDEIKLVPFSAAINLSKNRQYLKYALLPILALLFVMLGAPNLIRESTDRLINNDKTFEKPAPFKFFLQTDTLEVVQYNDIEVKVRVDGSVLPNEAFIHVNNFPYKLRKEKPNEFAYTFAKVQKDQHFYFEANGYRSEDFVLSVIPKPVLVGFDAVVEYPAYTGRQNETLKNSGDMIVPVGTKVTWNFEAQHTNTIRLKFGSESANSTQNDETNFSFAKRILKDTPYSIFLSNERIKNADSIAYSISTIPDAFPAISAQEKRDSSDDKTLYFLGDASDDYGIKSLYFKYKIEKNALDAPTASANKTTIANNKPTNEQENYQSVAIDGTIGKKTAAFTHTWDVSKMGMKPGDKMTYFFEVWDNDAVNGSKFARTQMMAYELPTIEQMDEIVEQKNEELKDDLDDVKKQAEKLKNKADELKKDMLEKKELAWEDKAKLENFMKEHKELQNKIENVQENFNENLEKQQEFKEFTENIQEKQQQLQKLMDELMSDEMKELMQKLEKLLEELKKEDAMEQMEDFEKSSDQLQKELDRMLELFKQMEFDQKMEETLEKLNDLAEQEEKLSEESEKKQDGSDMKEQKEKQADIEKKFDDIKKDIEDLQKKNEELGNKNDLQKETEEEQKDAEEEMQQSQEQMDQKQAQDAAKSQKSASKKMKKMAEKMQAMQMQMEAAKMEMDMQAIRQLIENLVKLSMSQEKLMNDVQTSEINTPQYTKLVQEQHKIKDDATVIEDSLVALSKRVFQLESFITKELGEVEQNLDDALENLEDRSVGKANANQQYVMTGLNNLALMLDEAMQQMQQQMMMQMQGSGSCNKPGGKGKGKGNKPCMSDLGKMQKQLQDRIEKAQQEAKAGKKPGGKDKGGQSGGKNGDPGMSKELSQMAARQAAIRQALEQINRDQNKNGKKPFGDLSDLIKDMEKTEEDLVNKRLTDEMLKRQQEIMSRMLKATEAERQQEQDNQREANRGREKTKKIPPEIQEYLKKKEAEIELYKTMPPALKPYYKDLVEKYFKSISF